MKEPIRTQTYHSPVGPLVLADHDGRLCLCDWPASRHHAAHLRRLTEQFQRPLVTGGSDLLEETVRELDQYFSGQRRQFDLPTLRIGTAFQNRVWEALLQVPYAETCSYGTLALHAGRSTAVRAVAAAIGANPLSIILPCHRITGHNGALVGYAGGIEVKRQLLLLESAHALPVASGETPDQRRQIFLKSQYSQVCVSEHGRKGTSGL